MRTIRINGTEHAVFYETVAEISLEFFMIPDPNKPGGFKRRFLGAKSFGSGKALLLEKMKIVLWYAAFNAEDAAVIEITGDALNKPTTQNASPVEPGSSRMLEEIFVPGTERDAMEPEQLLPNYHICPADNRLIAYQIGIGNARRDHGFDSAVFYKAYLLSKDERDIVFQQQMLEALKTKPISESVKTTPQAAQVEPCGLCGWIHPPDCSAFEKGGGKITLTGRAVRLTREIHSALESGAAKMAVQDLMDKCGIQRQPSKVFNDAGLKTEYRLLFDTKEKWFIGFRL